MVRVIGGKCLRPEHVNVEVEQSRKEKRKRDAEAKKRSQEKPGDVSCAKCNCLHSSSQPKDV